PGEATQAWHRAQPPHRQRSTHSPRPDDPLQAGQRSAEHRIIDPLEPLRDDSGLLTPPQQVYWHPQPKFQDRVWLHGLLFVLTIASTTAMGADHYAGFLADFRPLHALPMPWLPLLIRGFWYSGTILAILGCHELGHYLACRYYDVDASLPFFLPFPISITGTLGAFIRIREPIPTKRMLFDIGIAGPIAGFLVALP